MPQPQYGLAVGIDGTQAQSGARTVTRSLDDISRSATSSTSNIDLLQQQMSKMGGVTGMLKTAVEGMAAAFAAWKLMDLVRDSSLLAARVETLGVVMRAVGNNAGYSGKEMDGFAKSIAAQGITTEASRQSAVRLAQAQVDMTKASGLARIAQDAAVIANTNSSDAFDRMTTGISTGQAIILHHMGLMVNFEKGYQDLAATLGKTSTDLTENEKTTARVNEVMRAGAGIAGSYESAMGTAGKQLNSMARFTDELKLAWGALGLPTLTLLVSNLTEALKEMNKETAANKSGIKDAGASWASFTDDVLTRLKKDLSQVSALLLDMKSGLYLLGAIAATPGMVAGDGLVKRMLAQSNAAADSAKAIRDYADAVKAADNGLPARDTSDLHMMAVGQMQLEDKRIAAGNAARALEASKKKEVEYTDVTEAHWRKYSDTIEHMNKQIRDSNPFLDELAKKLTAVDDETNKAIRSTPEYTKSLTAAGEALKHNITLADDLTKAIYNTSQEFQGYLDASGQATPQNNAAGDFNIRNEEMLALVEQLKPTAGLDQLNDQIRKLTGMMEDAPERAAEFSDAIGRLKYDAGQGSAFYGMTAAIREYGVAAADVGRQVHDTFINAFQSIEQALTNMITKGKGDFHSLLSSLGTDIAGMLVKQNVTGPITSFLGQAISGQGTSGLSGLFSTGSMFFANITEGVKAGASTGILSGFKEGFSTMISGGSTNFAGGLGMMLPAAGTAGIAAYAANSYFGPGGLWNKSNDEQKAWRGAAMTNPIGWTALGLDWATGGGLFGTNWNSKGSGVMLGVDSGDIGGHFYQDQSRKKAFWGGTQNRTILSDLDNPWTEFVHEQYDSITSAIKVGGRILGDKTVSETLKSFSSASTKISLSGLSSEDQQKAVQTYFQNLTNDAIKKLYPEIEQFTKLGEDAATAFNRITTSLQAVNEAATITGNKALSTSLSSGNDDSSIVTAVGGASNLASLSDQYSKTVNTDDAYSAAKAAADHRSIAMALADQNVTIPQTISDYKNLVEAQDLSTQSGRDLYAILLQLAPTFADLKSIADTTDTALTELKANQSKLDQDAAGRGMVAQGLGYTAQLYKLQVEQENELVEARKKGLDVTKLLTTQQEEYAKAVSDIYKTAASEAISVQENILQGLTEILKSNASPLQKYEADKTAYETTKALALQGDKQALADLTGKVTAMLDSSSAYNASSAQFQADKADAVATLAGLAGLGTSSPTLEAAQSQLSTLQSIQTALSEGNKDQVQYLKGLLNNTGILAQYLTGYLANLPGSGTQTAAQAITSLPSFAVGSPGLPSDMLAQVHQNEIIMDATTSQALQRYGIQVGVADNYGTSFSAGLQATNSILEMQVRYLSMIEQNTAASVRVEQAVGIKMIGLTEQLVANSEEVKRKIRQGA